MSEPFSAIMMTGEFVLPLVMVGMTEASTTRSPLRPRTRRRSSNDRQIVGTHLTGADGVENGRCDVAGRGRQFVVALELDARLEFLGRESLESGVAR